MLQINLLKILVVVATFSYPFQDKKVAYQYKGKAEYRKHDVVAFISLSKEQKQFK